MFSLNGLELWILVPVFAFVTLVNLASAVIHRRRHRGDLSVRAAREGMLVESPVEPDEPQETVTGTLLFGLRSFQYPLAKMGVSAERLCFDPRIGIGSKVAIRRELIETVVVRQKWLGQGQVEVFVRGGARLDLRFHASVQVLDFAFRKFGWIYTLTDAPEARAATSPTDVYPSG